MRILHCNINTSIVIYSFMIRHLKVFGTVSKTVPFLCMLLLVGTFYLPVMAQPTHNSLPRSTPEQQQVSSAAINAFLDAASQSKNEFHSFMLLRHGHVIAEGWWQPYAPDLKHTLYSVSKSFTATAIGLAVSEKKLSVNDKVISFFEDQLPDTVSAFLEALTVKDLLTMSVGHATDPTGQIIRSDEDWVKAFLRTPIAYQPGSQFLYNSMATFMLSAIIQKVTGEKLVDYLNTRLFQPLRITDLDWELNPQGINSGGWGLRLRTEDMAKFGQLFLQKGRWQGQQIVPQEWVEEASAFKIKNAPDTALELKANSDWAQGYCYQMWRCRNNAYRADGAFGQYIIVMPEQDAVLAITSETADMQSIQNLVWQYLLPALQNQQAITNAADAGLKRRVTQLTIPLPAHKTSTTSKRISGKTYTMQPNEAGIEKLRFEWNPKMDARLIIQYATVTDTLLLGANQWLSSVSRRTRGLPSLTGTTAPPGPDGLITKTAAAYTWQDDQHMEIRLRYLESPHSEQMHVAFKGKTVSVKIDSSIKGLFPGANDKNPVLTGFY